MISRFFEFILKHYLSSVDINRHYTNSRFRPSKYVILSESNLISNGILSTSSTLIKNSQTSMLTIFVPYIFLILKFCRSKRQIFTLYLRESHVKRNLKFIHIRTEWKKIYYHTLKNILQPQCLSLYLDGRSEASPAVPKLYLKYWAIEEFIKTHLRTWHIHWHHMYFIRSLLWVQLFWMNIV